MVQVFELKQNTKMNIYLYDYVVDQPTNSIFLFGIDEQKRKHQINLGGFQIYVNVCFDDLFNQEEIKLLERIPLTQSYGNNDKKKTTLRYIKDIMKSCEKSDIKAFKGVPIINQNLYRIEFDSLDNYSAFKRAVSAVN